MSDKIIKALFKLENKIKRSSHSSEYLSQAIINHKSILPLEYLSNFQNISTLRKNSSLHYSKIHDKVNLDNPYEFIKQTKIPTLNGKRKYIFLGYDKNIVSKKISELFSKRKTKRDFSENNITFSELETLLKTSISVHSKSQSKRPYPSGGGLYPIEPIIMIRNIKGIENGFYYYSPKKHSLTALPAKYSEELFIKIFSNQQIKYKNINLLFLFFYNLVKNYIKYADLSLSLAFIEVGTIIQNIHIISTDMGFATCDIGGFPKNKIENHLKVNKDFYHLVHILALGRSK